MLDRPRLLSARLVAPFPLIRELFWFQLRSPKLPSFERSAPGPFVPGLLAPKLFGSRLVAARLFDAVRCCSPPVLFIPLL